MAMGLHEMRIHTPAHASTDSRGACAATSALVPRVFVARIPKKKEESMGNVKQLGVVPVGKRLSDAEIQMLTAAGFEVRRFIGGHFTATRESDGASFDSRSVVGDTNPIAFTLRAIAAHLEQSAR